MKRDDGICSWETDTTSERAVQPPSFPSLPLFAPSFMMPALPPAAIWQSGKFPSLKGLYIFHPRRNFAVFAAATGRLIKRGREGGREGTDRGNRAQTEHRSVLGRQQERYF